RLDGYEPDGLPGEPMLPVRIVTIAVPPTGVIEVHAVGVGEAAREGVLLAPVPRVERAAPDGRAAARPPRYERSTAAYASRTSRAPERATLVGVSWMRNQRIARIAIHPADYAPATRRLLTWSHVEVTVDLPPAAAPGTPAEPRDPFESV